MIFNALVRHASKATVKGLSDSVLGVVTLKSGHDIHSKPLIVSY